MTQEEIIKNLNRCPSFESCNQNLCPLDLDLGFRFGGKADRCRYMREPKRVKIKGREFMSGGTVMPDAPLKFVPERNLKWLNEASRKRWHEVNKN